MRKFLLFRFSANYELHGVSCMLDTPAVLFAKAKSTEQNPPQKLSQSFLISKASFTPPLDSIRNNRSFDLAVIYT